MCQTSGDTFNAEGQHFIRYACLRTTAGKDEITTEKQREVSGEFLNTSFGYMDLVVPKASPILDFLQNAQSFFLSDLS